ncbi:guanine nucleotide exchange factor VAV2 isoform X1 [Tachysurus ichikawai]
MIPLKQVLAPSEMKAIFVNLEDIIRVHFALLRAIDQNMVIGGSGLGKIFLDFKESRRFTFCTFLSLSCLPALKCKRTERERALIRCLESWVSVSVKGAAAGRRLVLHSDTESCSPPCWGVGNDNHGFGSLNDCAR